VAIFGRPGWRTLAGADDPLTPRPAGR